MPEEIKTAETTVDTEIDDNAGVDQNETEDLNSDTFTDSGADNNPDAQKDALKKQNSENARRRREAERRAEIKRAEESAREKAIIEALDGKNPYTNEEMKDSADVKEFLLMRDIEKNGGDPLSDFSKFHKQREREAAEAAERQSEEDAWFANDRALFISKHPDVDIEQLIRDESFRLFAKGKEGKLPLSEIYEDFTSFTADYEKKAKGIAAQRVANHRASPGALSTPGTADDSFYSEEEVRKMSTAEIQKNYEKVRKSMTRWRK